MIKRVTIKNFIGFEVFEASKLTGLNLIIGENDTGKTGIIKILYAICKAIEEFELKAQLGRESFKKVLSDKLLNTFMPRKSGLGELVKKGAGEKLSVEISLDGDKAQNLFFSFGERTTTTITDCSEHINLPVEYFNSLFIPAKEVLTTFDIIGYSRESVHYPDFDDTYYDLVKALRVKPGKGNYAAEFKKVNEKLEGLFDGIIIPGDERQKFLFKRNGSEFSMPLTAEGIKKIGILTTLIKNRQIGKNTVLFLDEPETALHPRALRLLAEMLNNISKSGVQVFLTTHNYFILKQLSIIARRENRDINCFSLVRGADKRLECRISNLVHGLPENPIVEEALKMFDDETELDLKI